MTLVKDQFDIQTIRELLHIKSQDDNMYHDEVENPKQISVQNRNY